MPARTNATLPRGPRMPMPLQTAAWWSRPIPFLERARARYGRTFTARFIGDRPWVMLSDPADLKELFTAPPDLLHPGEGAALLEPVVGSNSMLLLDRDRHMAQRKLVLPAFHGKRMAALKGVIAEVTEAEIERWPGGEPMQSHPRMQALTLEVILRAVFGLERGDPRLGILRDLLPVLAQYGSSPISLLPMLQRGPGARIGPTARFLRTRERIDAEVYDLIAERRRSGEDRDDVLTMLLSAQHDDGSPMSDEEVRDELMTLMIAGHETTATELAWCLERLAREPRVLGNLVDEIDAGEEAYVLAVVRETLRRRPVLINVQPRRVVGDIELGGHRYPAGSCNLIGVAYLVHHDPEIYDEPYAFRPERFLESEPGTYTWIPFGGGRRRCIGASFAQMEMVIVLQALLSRFELRPSAEGSELNQRRMITVTPSGGARVQLRPRDSAAARRRVPVA